MANRPHGIEEQRLAFIEGSEFLVRAVKKYCDDPTEILGIDPARGSTGWAYRFKSGEIETGAIVPSGIGFSKIIKIEKQLREMIEELKPFIVIEGYAMNAKWGREAAGELGGVIRRLLYFKKRPLLAVAPLTIKAWIHAKKKDQIMLEILDQYKLKISNNDAADAFLLQEVGHKAILMAQAVVGSKIKDPEEIRLFLKDEEYKDFHSELEKLFRYQEGSLFRLIMNQGPKVEFFSKVKPSLENY